MSGLVGSSPLARGLLNSVLTPHGRNRIIPARAGFTYRPSSRRASTRDHPRSRGVYLLLSTPSLPKPGSSPLARGLLLFNIGFYMGVGIIPARAGFTDGSEGDMGRRRDHPRSRGVYAWKVAEISELTGSSPLARGLPTATATTFLVLRIIPARAGFTLDSSGVSGHTTGSSPLARGLPVLSHVDRHATRIIPARAGFTILPPRRRPSRWDHPRSRGVYASRAEASP